MKHPVKNIDLETAVFAAQPQNFTCLALELFQFQYKNNPVYQQYCNALQIDIASVSTLEKIPFLPVQFFKTHTIQTTAFTPQTVFESSGTTGTVNSKHALKDIELYKKSFITGFNKFYSTPAGKCILGLLPSYLERSNSSLVFMVDELINQSNHTLSGFYLTDYEKLHRTLLHNEILKQPTLLFGVTYALLDFAEQYPMQLRHTTIIETGGMKGRRQEITRLQLHQQLQEQLGVSLVHAEYGMTELLSQAYSKGDGIFHTPAWMKLLIREADDPLAITAADESNDKTITGLVNIIDLANIYSCAFIATDDVGCLYHNGSFEILGRKDNSDTRGCSLLLV